MKIKDYTKDNPLDRISATDAPKENPYAVYEPMDEEIPTERDTNIMADLEVDAVREYNTNPFN